jgi:hypothetical protein
VEGKFKKISLDHVFETKRREMVSLNLILILRQKVLDLQKLKVMNSRREEN